MATAVPDRPYRMDHEPRRQAKARSDARLARGATTKGAAMGEEFGPGGAVDGAIDTATAQ
ncbi:hypothetical protein D3C80_1848770 [compost metagenome]